VNLTLTGPLFRLLTAKRRLEVKWQGEVLASIPLKMVERVVLLGPAQVSAAAALILMQARIPVLFCSSRGNYYGMLSPGYEDVEFLLLQVERYRDEGFRLNIAKAIVSAKIKHKQRLLRRYARNHPNPNLTQTAQEMNRLLNSLSIRSSVPEVMGIEGQASALYFSAFGQCLRQEGITFTERNRHPPKDPVNALLSLGYMLVLGEVVGALMAQGLHIGLGFLHEVSRRRPALALDLLELARQPIVDRLTLSLFNLNVFKADDFDGQPNGAVRLKEKSLKRYLQYYERTMTTPFRYGNGGQTGTFRDYLKEQAAGLKKAVQENNPWTPTVLQL